MGLSFDIACVIVQLGLSHTRTVVRECFKGDEASQWKRPKFDPSPHLNPLTDLHKIGRHDYLLGGTWHAEFCGNRFEGFCSPNTSFCRASGVTSFSSFFGFFSKATAYTPKRIFTQNTSNDVVLGKEVPFGVPMTIFYIYTLKFSRKNRHFGDRF